MNDHGVMTMHAHYSHIYIFDWRASGFLENGGMSKQAYVQGWGLKHQ